MKEKSKIQSKAFPCILLSLSVIGAILFNAARATWVFVDIAVKIDSFTLYLLYAMVVNCVLGGVLTALRLYEIKTKNEPVFRKKAFSALSVISLILSVFFFVVAVVFFIIMASRESAGVYSLYLRKSLYDAAFFVLVPCLSLFFPLLKGKSRKAVLAVSLAVVSVLVICKIFPVGTYKITSDPTVIDTGKDYSVVFSTSDFGTGFVEYTFDGEDYKVYAGNGGRLISDTKIHSISVPYEHLDNNTYKIGSTRVVEQYSYGSRTGKEVLSDEYTFTPVSGDDVTYLVLSDWHTELEKAYSAVSYLGDYDGVILMGDSSPGLDFEEEAIKNIIQFSGKLSGGTMPVLYTRGNHETRGNYAGKLLTALGLESFYYTTDMGNYSFIVLDSGEDKDDSHGEYGGMDDYNTYRKEMVEWLKETEINNDKVIALSHAWQISEVEKDLSETAWNEIDRLGTKLLISGHTHQCRLVGESESEKEMLSAHPNITAYMDGGHRDGTYVASKMTVSADKIYLEAYNHLGEKVFEHSVDW